MLDKVKAHINEVIEDAHISGCSMSMDILHKKIQLIALKLFLDFIEYQEILTEEDYKDVRYRLEYCPWYYAEDRYTALWEDRSDCQPIVNLFLCMAIDEFIEDIL